MISQNLRDFLDPELRLVYDDGERLIASASGGFNDYSFVLFPLAKVYEGFLKKLFFKIGAINRHQYESERWRVGRALNPELEKPLRAEESVYDRILNLCGGPELPDRMWQIWKKGRNRVFHYFPGQHKEMTLAQAKQIVAEMEGTMEQAMIGCGVKNQEA